MNTNINSMPVPMDICMSDMIITSKKYVCDNCHNAYITSDELGELPMDCPFCNANISCGTLDISFDA